jgi:hypothetical protein
MWNRLSGRRSDVDANVEAVRRLGSLHCLLCDDDALGQRRAGNVRQVTRQHDGATYVFAVGMTGKPSKGEFAVPGVGTSAKKLP